MSRMGEKRNVYRLRVAFRNEFVSHGARSLAPSPNPKLEDHPLAFVRRCLSNIFAANLQSWRPSLPSATRGRVMLWWQGDPPNMDMYIITTVYVNIGSEINFFGNFKVCLWQSAVSKPGLTNCAFPNYSYCLHTRSFLKLIRVLLDTLYKRLWECCPFRITVVKTVIFSGKICNFWLSRCYFSERIILS
jgi:hypothetical protein